MWVNWAWLAPECPMVAAADSGQSGGQFPGRPSEVWSQWQSQHHGQQSGEQHSHPQPGQTEVFQVNRGSAAFPASSLILGVLACTAPRVGPDGW